MNALERFEEKALNLEQVVCPLTNIFADGIYWREILIPKGTLILGHEHKTEHVNVLMSGKVRVLVDGEPMELTAPKVFVTVPGIRKAIYALEDSRWVNVHHNPTNERDMDKIEDIFITKSKAFQNHKQLMEGK